MSDVIIIPLSGNLDVSAQSRLRDDLLKKAPLSSEKIVLDFSKVEFIDSACLGALVAVARKLRKNGGDVRIASPLEEVRSIFQITRLDKIFQIFANPEEAVTSFS
ncbi:MAG: STAS domain-containing protein [Deltaproteobacteria bacterium]|nr:STAS domain-containing protein [Deltaproteobacteria bacterium]